MTEGKFDLIGELQDALRSASAARDALGEAGAGFTPGQRVTVNGTAASVIGFRAADHRVGIQVDGDQDGPVWLDPDLVLGDVRDPGTLGESPS
ncbi:hypothetical protein DSM104299_03211 [Baekduia alba]|uniref:hypothetical protein n=1 Tax=Baekduia alba TaxID=2997333 RepID=UPI0023428615|nr:hypothetical protein [Baekduia alba]WCB94474.1 hypothetical protein DSM104299_03211 [Baekduia alba]